MGKVCGARMCAVVTDRVRVPAFATNPPSATLGFAATASHHRAAGGGGKFLVAANKRVSRFQPRPSYMSYWSYSPVLLSVACIRVSAISSFISHHSSLKKGPAQAFLRRPFSGRFGYHPPPIFSMILTSGRNSAMTIEPTMPANATIIKGSIRLVSALTELSTSSS